MKRFIHTPLQYVLHALFFFTRIPVGKYMVIDEKILINARILLPLIGLLLGGLSAGVFFISLFFVGKSVAILLSLLVAVLLTGGFHEDALADSVDAFGAGGHSSKDIITIMKDSRIGTYGTLALIFSFALSFYSLDVLPLFVVPAVIIFAHVASRFSAVPLMYWLSYVRHDSAFEKATKKHEKDMHVISVGLAFLFVVILALLLFGYASIWFLLVTLGVTGITGKYYLKRLGGVTGDCFGATIKIAEICIYLVAVVLYHV
jgi:adenosylcobinamide-GDP ribazoletransferase